MDPEKTTDSRPLSMEWRDLVFLIEQRFIWRARKMFGGQPDTALHVLQITWM